MAAFAEILQLLGPPRFNWSDNSCWRRLEEEICARFPEDFRRLSDSYGPIRINNQLGVGHPGTERGNLGYDIRTTVESWQGAPDGEVPYSVGTAPGELLQWASAASGETVFFRVPERAGGRWSVGVYESDEGEYHEYPMSFDEWMLAYLEGQDVTVCSRNFAPDGPFCEPVR
ncbi:SMI1/KNR4 family protein [Streptomyces drozdowiczii]